MSRNREMKWRVVALAAAFAALLGLQAYSQHSGHRLTSEWAQVPDGLQWGQLIGIDVDADGNIYALHRCSASDCISSDVPPLLKFDQSGKHLLSLAAGLLVWPHGIDIDNEGNIWLTDGRADNGRGQQVLKLSPEGEVLMTIGTAGVSGDGPYTFNGVADVLVADDGSIFVADGHVNARVVKYSAAGEFITEWGGAGTGPGEFNLPHALAMDSRGRLFVSDRENLRIQIFDQNGRYLDEWTQFGRVSGLSIGPDDTLYAASQNEEAIPSIATGIYLANSDNGEITGFIPDIYSESVVADGSGAIYTGLRARAGESQVIDDALRRIVAD